MAAVCRDVIDLPLESGTRLEAAVAQVVSFLYATTNEYLLLFGAPVATYGFSGRYRRVEIYKIVLAGRYTTYNPESAQIAPGELVSLPMGEVRNMEIASGLGIWSTGADQ